MKKILPVLMVSLVLLTVVQSGQAQQAGPLLIIQGTPDTAAAPPQVRTYVSVIDKSVAETIEGLTAGDFQVKEAETGIGTPEISYEPVGLAIVVVVDRGGISVASDPRLKEATDMVRELVARLVVSGAANDDVIAIVGVGEDGVLQPEENFSYNPVDTNLVQNALVTMEGETVRGGTPLYEGLDEAIHLLTRNPDGTIRDVLTHRRKVIVVFSDGLDPNFSDEAREQDIIRKAGDADISLYTIGMAYRNSSLSAEENMVRLARQTDGLYQLHNNDETHQEALNLFDRLMTQRQQYLISYQTRQPKGDYTLNIEVDTPIGSAERSVTFSSILETPQIALTFPTDGGSYTVPYSQTMEGFESVTIPFSAQVAPVDGAHRDPLEVRYFANGVRIGTSAAPPSFDLYWNVSEIVTPTAETQSQKFTLVAEADDAYLGQRMQSAEVNVEVTWGALPPPTPSEEATGWLDQNWWLLLILGALAVGLLLLLIMLIRTRGELTRRVVARTTGVLKGVTRRLSAAPQHAPGKLVIIQGANMGKEFRLVAQVIKVGRDPQFCDFALFDDFVSNPHFSIQLEQTQFFITDEGSTNGTQVNSMPLPPHQRILLQPDAIIELGQTRLQFKRLGGTTHPLEQVDGPAPLSQPQQPEPEVGGPTKQVTR
jgi:hypothetical protein